MPVRPFLLALAIALCIALPASAGELKGTLEQIHDSKMIRLGHLETAVPFSFVDQGVPQGYSVELCKRVVAGLQQQLGLDTLNIAWVPVDQGNRLGMVESGKVDLECGTTSNTLSRQEQVDFSLPIWVDGGSFAVKTDSTINGPADLAGKKVAVLAGTTTESALKTALANSYVNAELIPVKEHVQGLEMVYQNQADAYAADHTVLIGLALAVRQSMKLRLSQAMFSYEPYGLVMRKDDGDFRRGVNRALAGLYRGGQIKEVYQRWFGKIGEPSPLLAAMFMLNSLPE
jgi:polar amino acid transport system substrate-binding protein/glutamate/aspartate transport system substrate-binding protein